MTKDGFWDTIGGAIDSAIVELLSDQPYNAKCSDCDNDLDIVNCDADTDFDQFLVIVPCQHCIAKAVASSKKPI